jgi:hypothetical protein
MSLDDGVGRGRQAEEVNGWALRELEGILRAATCHGHAQNDRGRTRQGGLIPQLGYGLRDQCDRDIRHTSQTHTAGEASKQSQRIEPPLLLAESFLQYIAANECAD